MVTHYSDRISSRQRQGRWNAPTHDLRTVKNTWAVLRHMVHYRNDAMRPLKVEVSYRQADQIDEADITVIDDIRTYTIDKLASL